MLFMVIDGTFHKSCESGSLGNGWQSFLNIKINTPIWHMSIIGKQPPHTNVYD